MVSPTKQNPSDPLPSGGHCFPHCRTLWLSISSLSAVYCTIALFIRPLYWRTKHQNRKLAVPKSSETFEQGNMKSAAGVKEEGVTSPMDKSGESQQSLKKGPWTATEDSILADYVRKHGEGNWNAVQKNSGLQRCGKSCRLRWANHLRPNLKKGSFSPEEETLILQLHAQLGNKWARMAAQLPGRTDNEIKNYWNTRIKRRQRAGLPLYPPEIQRQVAYMNQRQGTVMILPNSIQHSNLMPTVSSAGATLFRNAAAVSGRGGGANYILANFDICLPSQQIPSSALYLGCEEGKAQQQLAAAPVAAMIGQGNNALMNALFKESQSRGEFFNEGLFFEPLPTACAPLSELPLQSPPLSSKCSGIDSLGKMEDSDISIGTQVNMQLSNMIATHDTSDLLDMVPIYVPTGPTTMVLSDWCCSGPSSVVTENVANTDIHHLSSSLSEAHDWSFTSGTWEAMAGIR